MSAAAYSIAPSTADQQLVSFLDFGLRAVERKMHALASADTIVAPVQLAVLYHLDSDGSRQHARWSLTAAQALEISLSDAVAIATCAELLCNAALLRADTYAQTPKRQGRHTVWAEFGSDTASAAGDVLISAAYAALALVSDRSRVAELVQLTHAATAATTDGRVKDLALNNVFVSDYAVYERVTIDKSAPLLALPFELLMTYRGFEDELGKARRVAEHLALANQIAEDLQCVDDDETSNGDSKRLNVVTVLRNMGNKKPVKVASANAYAALRKSILYAKQLPYGIAASLSPCLDAVFSKLETQTQ